MPTTKIQQKHYTVTNAVTKITVAIISKCTFQ